MFSDFFQSSSNRSVYDVLGHRFKLERADEHLKRLEDDVLRWLGTQPYRFIYEFNPESNEKIVRVEVIDAPPVKFGITIGDIVHNLRSALDNLAYELALAHTGDPLPREIAENSEFPIFSRPMTLGQRERRIGGIHPEAQAIIEGLQPYNRENQPSPDPLWLLYNLSNVDKHRLFPLTLVQPVGVTVIGPPSPMRQNMVFGHGPIEHHAVVLRYPYSGDPTTEMDMQFHITFSIGFGQDASIPETTGGAPDHLRRIHTYIVNDVVTPLMPYITPLLERQVRLQRGETE